MDQDSSLSPICEYENLNHGHKAKLRTSAEWRLCLSHLYNILGYTPSWMARPGDGKISVLSGSSAVSLGLSERLKVSNSTVLVRISVAQTHRQRQNHVRLKEFPVTTPKCGVVSRLCCTGDNIQL